MGRKESGAVACSGLERSRLKRSGLERSGGRRYNSVPQRHKCAMDRPAWRAPAARDLPIRPPIAADRAPHRAPRRWTLRASPDYHG